MIFNEAYNANENIYSLDGIEESQYELGIDGALMHVYENECNYNAIIKAAALSEMKYYGETGGDLFVQEAGALAGFVEKIKAFFKKVIEKIKSIFKKFMTTFDQFRLNNKDFLKKYRKDLTMVTLKDLTFKGYKLKELEDIKKVINKNATGSVTKFSEDDLSAEGYGPYINEIKADSDDDVINDINEKNRGALINGGGGAMTESEFKEKLKELLYGDKEDYDIDRALIDKCIKVITNSDEAKKEAEKEQKNIIDAINKAIKGIDKISDKKSDKVSDLKGAAQDSKRDSVHKLNKISSVMRTFCNDVTLTYSEYVKAIVNNTKLAKAICVKALTTKTKKESASVAEGGYGYDIFDNVEIV